MLTLFTPPPQPKSGKGVETPRPLAQARRGGAPALPPPTQAAPLPRPCCAALLSGVQGPPCICDSHGHTALHTGHGTLPPAGWGGAWAGSTDAHDPWAWSQVSHHPPSAAHYAFSRHGWSLWQEITIASKFRGKYLSIMPLGEQGQKTHWGRGGGQSLGPPRVTRAPPQASWIPPWPVPCPQPVRILLLVLRTPGSWVGGAGWLGPSMAGYDL